MYRVLGACCLFTISSFIAVAADPTPADALKFLDKIKAKYKADKKDATKIVRADLSGKKITDKDLEYVGALKTLQDLNLGGYVTKTMGDKKFYAKDQIGDKGMAFLAGLTNLTELTLDGTNVSDEGLKHLSGMTKLKLLVLSNTQVTDAGME